MTEFLKRSYNLGALKVTLETVGEFAYARCELQVTEQHKPRTVEQWDVSAAELGLPERLDNRRASGSNFFKKPGTLIKGLKSWLANNPDFRPPLWLHLVKPYGYLGMAPWERWIEEELKIPLLRLPDVVVEPPREYPKTLDVILCASRPMAKEQFDVVDHLLRTVTQIRAAVPHRRARFDVFTDCESKSTLEYQWRSQGLLGETVRLHSPDSAASYVIPRCSSELPAAITELESPWLLWMRSALEGRSVDLVQFMCHGYFSAGQSALAFAQTPLVNKDPHWSRFVGLAELRTFLLQVGAWSVAFSSPETNYSELGLRHLADTLAQERPGPVLYHDWRKDWEAEQLGRAYQFLFAPEPRMPDVTPAVFLYCQPFRVSGWQPGPRMAGLVARGPEQTAVESELQSVFSGAEAVPNWMAASVRYIEQCQWELSKTQKTEEEQATPNHLKMEEARGVETALAQIQTAMANLAVRTLKGH